MFRKEQNEWMNSYQFSYFLHTMVTFSISMNGLVDWSFKNEKDSKIELFMEIFYNCLTANRERKFAPHSFESKENNFFVL